MDTLTHLEHNLDEAEEAAAEAEAAYHEAALAGADNLAELARLHEQARTAEATALADLLAESAAYDIERGER